MTKPFRWKNCYSDVLSHRNGDTAMAYIKNVVEPSLAKLEAHIHDLSERHDDAAAVFGIGPARELHRATLVGYCLALQALWEKQLRSYLEGCARDLKSAPEVAATIEKATWKQLDSIFEKLRGVRLTAFEEYARLNLLQLLGNVCRHGGGPSLNRLAVEHPELWAHEEERELTIPPPPGPQPEPTRTVAGLQISIALLTSLAAAVDAFWSEVEYIYNESIERKADSLEARLVEERRQRAGRGRPWDPPGCTTNRPVRSSN